MINKTNFEKLKEECGEWASWALWTDPSSGKSLKCKENIGDLGLFDDDSCLEQLKPEYVLLGLNWSRKTEKKSWSNFHDPLPKSQDYKLRYALKGTCLWGAYMTDIKKNFVKLNSGQVTINEDDYEELKKELKLLASSTNIPLTIIALGNKVFEDIQVKQNDLNDDLKKYLNKDVSKYQIKIKKLTHYSAYISMQEYKEKVEKLFQDP